MPLTRWTGSREARGGSRSRPRERIRAELGIAQVTLADAIRFLCLEVAAKYQESLKVGKFPKDEINDDNRVNATPIDKVYEHGFYPLKGGFRAVTSEPYEVFDQWIEVLPTDQVVPVAGIKVLSWTKSR